jgi:murein DD-endopeptidase MepM/ murein hydrolase activator NlpD
MAFSKDNLEESKAITVVFIPSHGRGMLQLRMPHWLLWTLILVFVGSLGSAWWILGQRVRFQAAVAQVTRLKQDNLKIAEELSRGREALAQVAKLDSQLRSMLAMKSKRKLLEQGVGGPTEADQARLSTLLNERAAKAASEIGTHVDLLSRQASVQERSFEEIRRYVDQQRSLLARTPSAWPVHGWISSSFGSRLSPFSGSESFHAGIDIAKDAGSPIRATADGRVIYAGWNGGYGKWVVIDHGNGIATVYGHNSELKVSPGQKVRRGTIIALMGSTGESTGPHCHYEVRIRGVAVNPMKYMKN